MKFIFEETVVHNLIEETINKALVQIKNQVRRTGASCDQRNAMMILGQQVLDKLSVQQIYKYLNPDIDSSGFADIGIRKLVALCEFTADTRLLAYLGSVLGLRCTEVEFDPGPETNLVMSCSTTMKEASAFIQSVLEADEDKEITHGEMSDIEMNIHELHQAIDQAGYLAYKKYKKWCEKKGFSPVCRTLYEDEEE